jgi:hypothetical protein
MKSLRISDIAETRIGAIWSMNITPSVDLNPRSETYCSLTFDETQVTFSQR